MQKTFCSATFGCRVNQAETQMLNNALLKAGFQYQTNSPMLYIINSCAVTSKAEREVRQFIYQVKKKYPETILIVTGCAATKWAEAGETPGQVDLIVENIKKETLPELLLTHFGIKKSSSGNFVNSEDKFLASGRLFIKIQDGCHRFCSYCIVPYLRGEVKSKKIAQIVSEINNFDKKISEVILTAVNTQAFGLDTNETFVDLLEGVIKKTKVPRVSLGSLHPWSLKEDFLKFYKRIKSLGRLVNYFHIPVQSGSNKILTLMRRGYTKEGFLEKINQLADLNPFSLIGTDVIVGFLDEKPEDFRETYQLLKDSPISKFHIFRFSLRDKTQSFSQSKRFKEPTDEEKQKRAKMLEQLGEQKYRQFLRKHLDLSFPALFLEKRVADFQEVLLNNNVPALIRTKDNLRGEIKTVSITGLKEGKLWGRLA